jgi:hypothetical protein
MWLDTRWLAVSIVALSLGTALASEPSLGLSDDGTVILYRAEAGDLPGVIAERFGIAPTDLPAFLAANGIRDATRVPSGHVYRIPNPLAARAAEAEARAGGLTTDLASARAEVAALTTQVTTLGARSDGLTRRTTHLERLDRIWPWVRLAGIVLVLAAVAAGYVAYRSATRLQATERYARDLGDQLDERRRGALAERQAASRRELDLESALRDREHELASYRPARARPTGTH